MPSLPSTTNALQRVFIAETPTLGMFSFRFWSHSIDRLFDLCCWFVFDAHVMLPCPTAIDWVEIEANSTVLSGFPGGHFKGNSPRQNLATPPKKIIFKETHCTRFSTSPLQTAPTPPTKHKILQETLVMWWVPGRQDGSHTTRIRWGGGSHAVYEAMDDTDSNILTRIEARKNLTCWEGVVVVNKARTWDWQTNESLLVYFERTCFQHSDDHW